MEAQSICVSGPQALTAAGQCLSGTYGQNQEETISLWPNNQTETQRA
jgi:hypothetical protein